MNRRRLDWLFVVVFIIAALLAWSSYHGIALSDEYLYAYHAWNWSRGVWPDSPTPFAHRLGLVWPLAFFIKLFGGAPRVLIGPSFLAFLLMLVVVWYVLRRKWPDLAFPIILTLSVNPVLLFYAADVSHDMLMMVFATIGALILWCRQRLRRRVLGGILVAVVLFWGFLSKESVVYLSPLVLWAFFKDWRDEGLWERFFVWRSSFWRAFFISVIFLGVLYLSTYAWFTGDAFYRFRGMADHNFGLYSYHGKSVQEKLLRLTIYPPVFLLQSVGLGLLWVPVVLGVVLGFWRDRALRFPLVWLFSLLGMHWLGSSSFREWIPLDLDDRMWLLLIVPLSMVSLGMFRRMRFLDIGKGRWILFFLAGCCVVGLLLYPVKLSGLLLVLPVVVLLLLRSFRRRLGYMLFILPLLGYSIFRVVGFSMGNAFEEERYFLQHLPKGERVIVVTDSLLVDKFWAHFDFNPSLASWVDIRDWGEIESFDDLPKGWDVYLLYNPSRVAIMEDFFGHQLPDFVRACMASGRRVTDGLTWVRLCRGGN